MCFPGSHLVIEVEAGSLKDPPRRWWTYRHRFPGRSTADVEIKDDGRCLGALVAFVVDLDNSSGEHPGAPVKANHPPALSFLGEGGGLDAEPRADNVFLGLRRHGLLWVLGGVVLRKVEYLLT